MEKLTPLGLFKSLSEPTRLHIVLLLLSQKSLCVCELETALEEDQPKVSRHLALLRNQELLTTERRGKWVYYGINPDLPTWVNNIITHASHNTQDEMAVIESNLKAMKDRPNNCCA